MKLRSGKIFISYNTIKERCSNVIPLKNVQKEQIAALRKMLNSINGTVTTSDANKVLYTIMNVPEVLAYHATFRETTLERVHQILAHDPFKDIVVPEYRKIYREYFNWLKIRSDYNDSPSEIMTRVQSRTNALQGELIEKLYHPDRYEKMVSSYGEVWADIHLPY
jgi:hypothetical protein